MSFREVACVIGAQGQVLGWFEGSYGQVPDSQALWLLLWEQRENVVGVAHTHPGRGVPTPSYEDTSTWEAVEAALGHSLLWWISSADTLRWWCSEHPPLLPPTPWVDELRERSQYGSL